MSNQLPTNAGQLVVLGNKMVHGLSVEGVALGITQITAAQMQAAVSAFANAENAFSAGRSARQVASETFRAEEATLADWLGVVRTVLAGRFGQRWNMAWAQAGFISPTTAIPTKIEDRMALAGRLVAFFNDTPNAEVPSMLVTAAQGTSLLGAAVAAQQVRTSAEMALDDLETGRAAASSALKRKMHGLIKILGATLDEDDTRWLIFGLQMPGTPSTPGKPVNLTAQLDGTGAIIVACDAVPLATRYRWRMLLVGVETDYRLVARSVEPLGMITDVLPGGEAEIIVQAVNGTLQGVESDPVLLTVPLVGAKAAEPKPGALEAPIQPAPRHGHRNGSHEQARVS